MNSYESFFRSELIKLIAAERQERLDGLCKRVPHEEYLVRVGYLQALEWVAEEACSEAEKKLKAG